MRLAIILLFAIMVFPVSLARAEPADVCVTAFAQAETNQTLIPGQLSARGVAGAGRLHFHSAPDRRCLLKDLFVISGNRLEAYAEHGEFTQVIYWNAITGAGTAGWVLSSRLVDAATTIAAGPVSR